jgi:hypothetical protein
VTLSLSRTQYWVLWALLLPCIVAAVLNDHMELGWFGRYGELILILVLMLGCIFLAVGPHWSLEKWIWPFSLLAPAPAGILVPTGIKLRSFRDFLGWLIIGGGLYLIDCLITNDRPDVPWIERGIRLGPLPFLIIGWMLGPLIQVIKERIDSQPPG